MNNKTTIINGYKKNPQVLLLGDKRLYETSEHLTKEELKNISPVIQNMHEILMEYKKEYGKFRAIAAPQIGIKKRFIYMYIEKPVIFINPELKNKSEKMMEVWDDCMSFPDLLVKVTRHESCTIEYLDINWQSHSIDLTGDMSELIQHEYDHLDGILAVERAIDLKSFAVFVKK